MPSDGTKVATGCTVGAGIIAVLTAPVSVPALIGITAVTTAASCIVYKTGDTLDETKKTAKDGRETMAYGRETMAYVRETASSAEECIKTSCTIIIFVVCGFVICAWGYLAKNY